MLAARIEPFPHRRIRQSFVLELKQVCGTLPRVARMRPRTPCNLVHGPRRIAWQQHAGAALIFLTAKPSASHNLSPN